jgi:hypothetical protein
MQPIVAYFIVARIGGLQMDQPFDELKLLQDSYFRTWTIYVNWYTWFFGWNILAFSWIMTSKDLKLEYIPIFVAFMEVLLLCGMGTAYCMLKFNAVAYKRGQELLSERKDAGAAANGIFAIPITKFATGLIVACFCAGVVLWLYIYFRPPIVH